jgi:hypothetical protein
MVLHAFKIAINLKPIHPSSSLNLNHSVIEGLIKQTMLEDYLRK